MDEITSEIDNSWYRKPPGIRERRGAGGIVVRCDSSAPLIALVHGDNLPLYLLPKGGVEFGETDEQAARREIEEEAGLTDLVLLDDLGACERLSYDRTRWQVTRYFLFTTEKVGGTPTDTRHAYHAEWFPLDSLPSMFWPEQRTLITESKERIRQALDCGSER